MAQPTEEGEAVIPADEEDEIETASEITENNAEVAEGQTADEVPETVGEGEAGGNDGEVVETEGAVPRIEGEESSVPTADGYSEPVDGVVA